MSRSLDEIFASLPSERRKKVEKMAAKLIADERARHAPGSFAKYRNPDSHCTFPFEDSPTGYCFSFAQYIDENPGYDDIDAICFRCEFWADRKQAVQSMMDHIEATGRVYWERRTVLDFKDDGTIARKVVARDGTVELEELISADKAREIKARNAQLGIRRKSR